MGACCLHIGLPKTGSSAIQDFLRRSASALAARGVHYSLHPDVIAEVAGVPNGNGRALLKYLDPRRRRGGFDASAFGPAEFDRLYGAAGPPVALISSELLSAVDWEQLRRLRDEVLGDRQVVVIALARNIHDHALSMWNQSVKWHAYARSFEHYARTDYGNPQCRTLLKYGECFGWEAMRVISYDEHRHDILSPFLAELGVAGEGDWRTSHVNPSLAAAEVAVQMVLNRLHGDIALAKDAAARLNRPGDALRARPGGSHKTVRVLRDRFRADFAKLSNKSGRNFMWMADGAPGTGPKASAGDYLAALLDVLPTLGKALVRVVS